MHGLLFGVRSQETPRLAGHSAWVVAASLAIVFGSAWAPAVAAATPYKHVKIECTIERDEGAAPLDGEAFCAQFRHALAAELGSASSASGASRTVDGVTLKSRIRLSRAGVFSTAVSHVGARHAAEPLPVINFGIQDRDPRPMDAGHLARLVAKMLADRG